MLMFISLRGIRNHYSKREEGNEDEKHFNLLSLYSEIKFGNNSIKLGKSINFMLIPRTINDINVV